MTASERQRLRELVSAARLSLVETACPNGYGAPGRPTNASGYRKGCRCRACTTAMTAAGVARRRRRKAVA